LKLASHVRATPETAAARLRLWLVVADARTLNVAGPRASKDAAIFAAVVTLLRSALP